MTTKQVNFEEAPSAVQDEETARLRKLLNMSVNEIELSVRAANASTMPISRPLASLP